MDSLMAAAATVCLPPAACWTGRVAVWAPFPQPHAHQQQQGGTSASASASSGVGGGLPPLKTSSRGVWLKSEAGGVLAVQWRPSAPPLLTVTLRSSRQLVHMALPPHSFAFRLVCPQHGAAPSAAAGGSSGHLLFLTLVAPGTGGSGLEGGGGSGSADGGGAQDLSAQRRSFTLAVHFDTAQAGRECGALLQALQQGSLQVAQPAGRAAPDAQQAVPGQASAGGGSIMGDARVAGTAAGIAAADGAAGGALDAAPLFGFADERSLAAAIEAAQADPAFAAYVAQWELAVAQAERLMAKHEQPGKGSCSGAG